jgi:ribosomal 50S subunit-recycling heat shock protein
VRIDIFLKKVLLFKRRSEAKPMCDNHLIKVNDSVAKPSRSVSQGDIIEIETTKGIRKYRVLSLPHSNISKDAVMEYYEECQ